MKIGKNFKQVLKEVKNAGRWIYEEQYLEKTKRQLMKEFDELSCKEFFELFEGVKELIEEWKNLK